MPEPEIIDGRPWYEHRAELVVLIHHMHESGYPVSELLRALDKPWCYTDDYELARMEMRMTVGEGSNDA